MTVIPNVIKAGKARILTCRTCFDEDTGGTKSSCAGFGGDISFDACGRGGIRCYGIKFSAIKDARITLPKIDSYNT